MENKKGAVHGGPAPYGASNASNGKKDTVYWSGLPLKGIFWVSYGSMIPGGRLTTDQLVLGPIRDEPWTVASSRRATATAVWGQQPSAGWEASQWAQPRPLKKLAVVLLVWAIYPWLKGSPNSRLWANRSRSRVTVDEDPCLMLRQYWL